MSTKSAPRHGGVSALAVSGWPLRRKVALALAIPLLLAATLGGLRVRGDLREATNSSTSARQVTILGPAVDYLVAGERAMVAAHTAAQADLDEAVADLTAAATRLESTRDTADLNPDQRYQVDVVLDLSRALRESSPDSLSLGTWVAQLRQLQSGVTQLITTIVNAQLDPEPRLELLAQTLGGRFSLAMEQALAATERTGDTGSLELFAELGAEGIAIERLASALGDTRPEIATLRTANAERFRTVRTKGTNLGGKSDYAEYDALVDELLVGIDRELTTSATDARNRALANGGVTLAALVAAILLALLISRLILTPIRRVREGALSVAHEQLPDAVSRLRAGQEPAWIAPIDVETHEEIGQLARAVDDLHRQAVHLASGEAKLRSQVGDMFVTLSRRNTALVNQQLALIESLEKDEEDPRRLESLFRLDHLAARMRRTGDSLRILADAPSRFSGGDGLTVADAMQAATSGVQDYQRVRVGNISDLRIGASAAGDVVHLLTELVDNALTFSPPTANVTVSASRVGDGVRIDVADGGLGIPADSLAELNQILHSGGDVTPDTARRMGLFVVSRLAQRHGLTANLQRNELGGTTASVVLPGSVLTEATGMPGVPLRPDVEEVTEPTTVSMTPSAPVELDDLAARINGALGVRPSAPTLPQRIPAAPAAEALPVREPAPQPMVQPTPEPEPVREPDPAPARLVYETANEADDRNWIGTAITAGDFVRGASEEVPERLVADTAIADTAIAVNDDTDTPIFREMRSAWLSTGGAAQTWTTTEVEEGWEQAERVATAATAIGATGLPQRRPGSNLVPGGVTKPSAVIARNPEAVRSRLAAHAAGVSRGRRAAASGTEDSQHTEAGQE